MNGGDEPAFPRDERYLGHNGMTMRDYFAGQALMYLNGRKDIVLRDGKDIAALSYSLADDMLAERAKASNTAK